MAFALCSCAGVKDVSKDPRFAEFATKRLTTKKGLMLYEKGHFIAPKSKRYNLTYVDCGEDNRLSIVPVGSDVKFERILYYDRNGEMQFEGTLYLKGRQYPFSFYIGLSGVYPNSWQRILDYFEMH